jgi:nitroreductase
MVLAAWDDGIGSCPNGMRDPDRVARVLGLVADERPVIVVTFGYPERSVGPKRRSPQEWIARADRKRFEEVVGRL